MATRATSAGGKPPVYKIVMLGDSGVGKTSLVTRLTNSSNKVLNDDISVTPATMGIEFETQMMDTPEGKVKAQIWDMEGSERFARVLMPTYCRKAKGIILVYDITSLKSFESLSERWMTQLNDHLSSGDELAKLLVGNKSDLDAEREVPRAMAEAFCTQYGLEMLETSTKPTCDAGNVPQSFRKMIGIIHERALAASSTNSRGGIHSINGAASHNTVRLDEKEGTVNCDTMAACGCY